MSKEFYAKVNELASKGQSFATATVVRTTGSTSARASAKAVIDAQGKIIHGWVGGGCAESAVSEESLEALRDGNSRVINLDLDDEVKGVGMPCGGSMDVYIEPFIPKPQLLVIGHGPIAEALSRLGGLLNFSVIVNDAVATKEQFPDAEQILQDDSEMDTIAITPQSYVIVATQHKSDDRSLKKVLGKGAAYVALIASRKRTNIVLRYLLEDGVPMERLKEVKAPAGLDVGAVSPQEIALSIMAEIISIRRGGTGRPLADLKGSALEQELKETVKAIKAKR